MSSQASSSSTDERSVPSKNPAYRYVFTLNNYTDGDVRNLKDLNMLFPGDHGLYGIFFQSETGTEGTPHLQGYMRFVKPKRWAQIKSALGIQGLHFEKARSNDQVNWEYCSKEDTFDRQKGIRYVWGFNNNFSYQENIEIMEPHFPWQTDMMELIEDHQEVENGISSTSSFATGNVWEDSLPSLSGTYPELLSPQVMDGIRSLGMQ